MLLAATIIFVASFAINKDNLPFGYELPKVNFIKQSSIAFFVISLIALSISILQQRKRIRLRSILLLGIILIIYSISYLRSPFEDTALNGNRFREQGLIFYLSITLFAFMLSIFVNKKNVHLIFVALIFSSVIQVFIGYSQVYKLIQDNNFVVFESTGVFGRFGQPNFFANKLLIGFTIACFYALSKRKILRYFGVVSALLLISGVLLSFSTWALITLPCAVILMICYEFLMKRRNFSKLILGFYLLIIPANFIGILIMEKLTYTFRIDIWRNILNVIHYNLKAFEHLGNLLFGYGFDTQMEVFQLHKLIPGHIVDRSHNVIFDIILQIGLLGLTGIGAVFFFVFYKLQEKLKKRYFAFALIAATIWVIESLVHTNSAVNIFEFSILVGILAAATSSPQSQSQEGLSHFSEQ